jgi:hypothetical protein
MLSNPNSRNIRAAPRFSPTRFIPLVAPAGITLELDYSHALGIKRFTLAKELKQEPAVLSRGLRKLVEELARNPQLRALVETLCTGLRKGRRPKRSIRFA